MREGKPSNTAAGVAAARGLAGIDPFAASFLEGPLAAILKAAKGSSLRVAAVNVASFGIVDHIAMRTHAIDEAVRAAVRGGIEQLVILGAGLDARAFRMPELRDVRVLEVDHPASQAFKRARVAGRAPEAKDLVFVPVDFERDSLDAALPEAGHDAARPTLWLWEGVTPYLGLAAMRATLACVAGRSAPGSRLLVTYVTARGSTLGRGATRVGALAFRALGESLRATYEPDGMRTELASAGFRVVDDTPSAAWGARFGGGRRLLLLLDERLAVADR